MNNLEVKILSAMRGKKKGSCTKEELYKKVKGKNTRKASFDTALRSLAMQNKIVVQGGNVMTADSPGLISGVVVKVTATFGFVTPEGGTKDLFVPGRLLMGAMPGDKVLVKRKSGSGHLPEGEVVQINEIKNPVFSGVVQIEGKESFVFPDSYVKFPVRVSRRGLKNAKHGDKVVAELITRGERHRDHIARVVEAFGASDSAEACCGAVLAANDITTVFPAEVIEQAQAIAAGSGIHPKELAARVDFRGEAVFTIDGADSKDLDDAISLRRHENGWALGVHIADVSYYVTHGSPLDEEAFARGTSVYYADSVIPMLPAELSNGICSLNPDEDRLAFSALISLSPEGEILRYDFKKTVIRSRVKGVYTEVNAILDGTADEKTRKKYDGLQDLIFDMRELAGILTKNRYARGGMDLDTVESKIRVGPDGKAAEVCARERGESERIIEEFMLTANEAAASCALEKALPFVYRTHDSPAPDKVQNLYEVLEKLGVGVKRTKGTISTAQLAQILEKAKGTDAEKVIATMVLRTMAKAKYTEHNTGHFGLALKKYTHFTSPIRRYPDLTIHRILSAFVTGMKHENIKKRFGTFVGRSAAHSTEREIAAMSAERSCEDCYKAEYMQQFVGDEFSGIITGVTPHGIYVQLENTVEGLCTLEALPPGEWEFDGTIAYTQRAGNGRLRLGDAVRVKVLAAHVSAGQIDFAMLG